MPKVCSYLNCTKRASYGFKFEQPEFCKEHGVEKKAFTQYGICKCGKAQPRFARPDDIRPSCCQLCKEKDMVNVVDRRCKCGKHLASFGKPTDKRGCYCHECKEEGMINFKTRDKKCLCGKVIPSFGFKGDEKPSCCVACKKEGMINLVNDLCPCGKSAVFGFKGDKIPSFCNTCKKEGMENIVTKKCVCGKAIPSFGLEGSQAKHCKSCKTDDMKIITVKKCNCGKSQPYYGLPDAKVPTHCKVCKEDTMVDIRSKKCKCGKAQPNFGLSTDKKATCCVNCKTDKMVNIKVKMCKCGKSQPVFGNKDDKVATCCGTCKTEGMLDILSKKCKGLINYNGKKYECPYEHRAKKKYSYYCTYCFEQNFPDDPRTANIRKKSDEFKVKNYLIENIKKYSFIHDKTLWTGQEDCTCRRRIDFRTLIGNTLLCIEVDEHQHVAYKDDNLRYDDLMMLHGGKFIFIRFNPHSYIDEYGKRRNPELKTRLAVLKNTIETEIERILYEENEDLLEIKYLFYNA